jgi:nitroimidazol reductase NimA-like FMN-containing flavoprotein (pyridoxamine 5'-phosphate oxidase superfamily)
MTANLIEMTRTECLERLRRQSVGRVAFTQAALPAVRPVNYTMMGNRIVFRTRSGGGLARACDGAVVAFEVDDVAESGGERWSVLVVGLAEALEGSAAVRAVETGLVSAITIGDVTGRLLTEPADHTDR